MMNRILSAITVVVVLVVAAGAILVADAGLVPDRPEGAVEDDAMLGRLGEIFPDAADFLRDPDVDEMYIAVDADGEHAGYAAVGVGTGYGGDMRVLVGVGLDGSVVGSVLVDHSETAGFVDDIRDPAFRDQFVGKSADDPVQLDDDIDGVSGATGSASGYTQAVRAALDRLADADRVEAPDDDPVLVAAREIFADATDIVAHDTVDGVLVALDDETAVGYAVTGIGEGYGGDMKVVVGLDTDGMIRGAKIVSHQETAGFVDDIQDPAFREQFVGRSAGDELRIDVDIDGVSGATRSATGFAAAVRDAVALAGEVLE